MDILVLIMVHNDGNVDKKFQPSILNMSRENQDFPIPFQTAEHLESQSSFATKNYYNSQWFW